MKAILIGLGIGVALLAIAFYLVTATTRPSLASVSVAEAPWPAELLHLKSRLAAIDVPALSEEGSALHTHQHLSIFVHGEEVLVPAGIGIHEQYPAFISPLHVHDESGIVHIESPTVETFTLGQLFDIWGVRLDGACIGAYCTDDTNTLRIFVDGKAYLGGPRELELTPHAVIVITYGTDAELPSPIPSSYTFPAGL